MPKQEVTKSPSFNSNDILKEAEDLICQFKTVQLATLNDLGNPEASYTPYIRVASCYYVFISGLASHTGNILQHPTLSLFFIQNEAETKNLFARRRLTLECSAKPISRDDKQWGSLLDTFRSEHGPTVDVLRTLSDFQLFELTPSTGCYVKGFGQAFILEGANLQDVRQSKGK